MRGSTRGPGGSYSSPDFDSDAARPSPEETATRRAEGARRLANLAAASAQLNATHRHPDDEPEHLHDACEDCSSWDLARMCPDCIHYATTRGDPVTAARALGWATATTLAELGELTARWLEGAIPDQPGCRGGPADETRDLAPILAALNRAGYVTYSSQPAHDGDGYDGAWWQQRAAAEGFTNLRAVLARIVDGCEQAGLTVIVNQATRWRCRYNTAVGVSRRHDGDRWHETCGFGVTRSRRDLAGCYDTITRPALRAVQDAWQVTVVDPWWGREDALWTALAGCLDLPEGIIP